MGGEVDDEGSVVTDAAMERFLATGNSFYVFGMHAGVYWLLPMNVDVGFHSLSALTCCFYHVQLFQYQAAERASQNVLIGVPENDEPFTSCSPGEQDS